mgnify:CR=1 FL=1
MNNYEAFVYKWTKTDGFWYIGFHKGSIDDGYISSGEYFLEDYNKNPDLWTREILATGTISEMYDYETELLQEFNAKDDSAHTNTIEIGTVNDGKIFKAVFLTENFKMIHSTYNVDVSKAGLAHFKNEAGDLEYYIAIEAKDSKFGE